MTNKSPYRKNKPQQITLKNDFKDKLYQVVLDKEKNGWECVVPIQAVKSDFDGSVTYKTVMRFVNDKVYT